jgi:hypothetical protein
MFIAVYFQKEFFYTQPLQACVIDRPLPFSLLAHEIVNKVNVYCIHSHFSIASDLIGAHSGYSHEGGGQIVCCGFLFSAKLLFKYLL